MSGIKKWRVHLPAVANGGAWVERDGVRLTDARKVTVTGEVGEFTTVVVEFAPLSVDIDAETNDESA